RRGTRVHGPPAELFGGLACRDNKLYVDVLAVAFQMGGVAAFGLGIFDDENERVPHHFMAAWLHFVKRSAAQQVEGGIKAGMEAAILGRSLEAIEDHRLQGAGCRAQWMA